ncbi:lipopolysaccharide assembly protein LapA domain-containing protein [Pseudomonas syringae]|uniref:lipopolysaccharide assembly protein LapA domain-containing protein n=1 Tax=Pseudomonas syringae TaxID=317 RepID=UPI001F21758F|nr:lipopolysaccharide assembly protein LapA domain-containing protein [Pseudomonas syringae]MCF5725717.1 DUF1049 domain-containing protein [Pseudomonas syringae]
MPRLKRVIAVFTALVVVLVVVGFVLENQQNVSLSFLGWSTAQIPVSVFVVIAVIGGMIVGPLLGFAARGRRRKSNFTASS